MAIPQNRNLRWSLDFVADTLVSGRRFRILTVVDDFTRECLTLVAETLIPFLLLVMSEIGNNLVYLQRGILYTLHQFQPGREYAEFELINFHDHNRRSIL